MVLMGALAENTSFSAVEIEAMGKDQMEFWCACLNLYHEEVRERSA